MWHGLFLTDTYQSKTDFPYETGTPEESIESLLDGLLFSEIVFGYLTDLIIS